MSDRRTPVRRARFALLLTALLYFSGALALTHAPGGWTEGSAIHEPGECPDGGPAHNDLFCRSCQAHENWGTPGSSAGLQATARSFRVTVLAGFSGIPTRISQAPQARAPPVL